MCQKPRFLFQDFQYTVELPTWAVRDPCNSESSFNKPQQKTVKKPEIDQVSKPISQSTISTKYICSSCVRFFYRNSPSLFPTWLCLIVEVRQSLSHGSSGSVLLMKIMENISSIHDKTMGKSWFICRFPGISPIKSHLLRHPNAICQVQRHVLLRMLQRGRVVGPGTAPCAIRMGPPRYVCWLTKAPGTSSLFAYHKPVRDIGVLCSPT